MPFTMPSGDQIKAAGRNVGSFAAGAVALGVLGKGIDPQKLADAINSVSTELAVIAGALSVIWGVVAPYWAAWKSSRAQRVKSVEASSTEHVITTDPTLKAAVPSVSKVDGNAATAVVPTPDVTISPKV